MTPNQLHRIYPSCQSDACGQNSRKCKTPEACQVPMSDDDPMDVFGPSWAIRLAVAVALMAILAALFSPLP